eukprot:m51a1_g4722 putative adenylate cyclase (1019) ;mRNA; f:323931-328114
MADPSEIGGEIGELIELAKRTSVGTSLIPYAMFDKLVKTLIGERERAADVLREHNTKAGIREARMTKENRELQATLETLRMELSETSARVRRLTEERNAAHLRLEEKTKEVAEAFRAAQDAERRTGQLKTQLEANIAELQLERKQLQSLVADLTARCDTAEASAAQSSEKAAFLEGVNTKLTERVKDLEKQLSAQTERMEKEETELASIAAELVAAKDKEKAARKEAEQLAPAPKPDSAGGPGGNGILVAERPLASGNMTVVVTNVEGSLAQREQNPEATRMALETQFRVLRSKLPNTCGLEARVEGDSMTVIFETPSQAAWWCVLVQEALLLTDWSPATLKSKYAREERSAKGLLLFRGLRVRMGVYYGHVVVHEYDLGGRVDYLGEAVNRATSLSRMANGGQVVAGQGFVEVVGKIADAVVARLGACKLKGLARYEEVYQILPNSLRDRAFPPLNYGDDFTVFHDQTQAEREAENQARFAKLTSEADDLFRMLKETDSRLSDYWDSQGKRVFKEDIAKISMRLLSLNELITQWKARDALIQKTVQKQEQQLQSLRTVVSTFQTEVERLKEAEATRTAETAETSALREECHRLAAQVKDLQGDLEAHKTRIALEQAEKTLLQHAAAGALRKADGRACASVSAQFMFEASVQGLCGLSDHAKIASLVQAKAQIACLQEANADLEAEVRRKRDEIADLARMVRNTFEKERHTAAPVETLLSDILAVRVEKLEKEQADTKALLDQAQARIQPALREREVDYQEQILGDICTENEQLRRRIEELKREVDEKMAKITELICKEAERKQKQTKRKEQRKRKDETAAMISRLAPSVVPLQPLATQQAAAQQQQQLDDDDDYDDSPSPAPPEDAAARPAPVPVPAPAPPPPQQQQQQQLPPATAPQQQQKRGERTESGKSEKRERAGRPERVDARKRSNTVGSPVVLPSLPAAEQSRPSTHSGAGAGITEIGIGLAPPPPPPPLGSKVPRMPMFVAKQRLFSPRQPQTQTLAFAGAFTITPFSNN